MKTQLVFSTGLLRSGSTWSFNVCRLLAQIAARELNQPFWAGYLTLEQTEQFLADSKASFPGPTIIKTHGIGPLAQQLLKAGRATAVCTYRDPRDCVASLITFTHEPFDIAKSRILQGLQMLDVYTRRGQTLFIRYEDMYANRLAQIRKIAAHLELAVNDAVLRRIDQITSLESSQEICQQLTSKPPEQLLSSGDHKVDPKTYLHDNHIQNPAPGRWKNEMSPDQVRALEQDFNPWLDRLGYLDQAPQKSPAA